MSDELKGMVVDAKEIWDFVYEYVCNDVNTHAVLRWIERNAKPPCEEKNVEELEEEYEEKLIEYKEALREC